MFLRTSLFAVFALATLSNIAPAAEREIGVKITVPSSGWKVSINEVYQVGEELWVVSQLTRPRGPSLQVISKVSDAVKVDAPELPVKHIVLGKTWRWQAEKKIQFPANRKQLDKDLKEKEAKLLYKKKAGAKLKGSASPPTS